MSTEHNLYKTDDADKPTTICDDKGNVILKYCRTCCAAEDTLTTHCPGHRIPSELQKLVHGGFVDFVNGAWVAGPTMKKEKNGLNIAKDVDLLDRLVEHIITNAATFAVTNGIDSPKLILLGMAFALMLGLESMIDVSKDKARGRRDADVIVASLFEDLKRRGLVHD